MVGTHLHLAGGVGFIIHQAILVLPTMVHPIIVEVTRLTHHSKKLWVSRGLVNLVEEEMGHQVAPPLQLLERVHLLIEAVAFGRRDSVT